MTVIYYLVDTDEGGGTVFPLADTSDEILEKWETSNHPLKYKQTRTCVGEDPNRTVVVKPKRGKAIIWYVAPCGYPCMRPRRACHAMSLLCTSCGDAFNRGCIVIRNGFYSIHFPPSARFRVFGYFGFSFVSFFF